MHACTHFVTDIGQVTVYPTVEVQAEGIPASFNCSVYTEQLNVSVLSWRVNGTTLIENPRPNITADIMTNNKNSVFLSVLRILALPQYNGTVAQCVVYPTRDVSDNVTLLVQGWCSIAALMGIIYFENSVCNYHLAIKLIVTYI